MMGCRIAGDPVWAPEQSPCCFFLLIMIKKKIQKPFQSCPYLDFGAMLELGVL